MGYLQTFTCIYLQSLIFFIWNFVILVDSLVVPEPHVMLNHNVSSSNLQVTHVPAYWTFNLHRWSPANEIVSSNI
jgi:hypothetical protein